MYRGQRAASSLSIPDISSRSPSDSIDLSTIENLPTTMEMDSKSRMPATPADSMGRRPVPWALMTFYGGNEGPWVPPLFPNHVIPSEVQRKANPAAFQGYRSAQPSECGTIPQGQAYLPSDSGYESRKPDDMSNYGDMERNHDTQSLSEQLITHDFFLHQSWNSAATPVPTTQNGTVDNRLICPDCNTHCKTKSELNKHNQRHRKAFRCEVPGCSRKEGFGTLNDLDRHRNSVHPEQFSQGQRYRCNIGTCVTKDKIWPRADNFRQHLKRVHQRTVQPDDDLGEFVLPSPQKPEEHLRQTVQEDLEGVGSDLFPAFNTGAWGGLDDVQLSPPEQAMEVDLLVDPSLTSVGGLTSNVPLNPSSVEMTVTKAQVPEQGSNQDLKDHSQPAYGSMQNHHEFVRPGEISRPASAKTVTVGRTEVRPNGLRAIQSHGSVPDNSQHEVSEDPMADSMDCDSLPKEPSARDPSDSIASGRSDSKRMIPQDQPTDQSSLVSFSSAEELNEQDMLKVLSKMPKSFIESFLKGNAENLLHRPAPASNSNTETHQRCPETGCGKTFHRKCELKKHMKRHAKPYGCTFPGCNKRFGSKNDWKRHENSQHFQLEVWKCDEKRTEDDNSNNTANAAANNNQQSICGKVCHRRETFRSHLQKEHRIEDTAQVDRALDKCRVGRNGESRFWCGFCVRIIEITKKGSYAWAERFNHIDNHYSGRDNTPKKDISQWKYVDPDLPEVDLGGSPDDSSDAESVDEAIASRKHSGSVSGRFVSNASGSRKRAAEDDGEEPAAKRVGIPTLMWSCCKCNMDADKKLHDGCVNCSHMRCTHCDEYTAWVDVDKLTRPNKIQTVEATA